MSKQRARRRESLLAERERDRLERERRERRRTRVRRVLPRLPRRRRVARVWSRRSRAQRATVLVLALAVVVMTFLTVDSWGIRLAVLALVVIATPALSTLAMGRSRG